MLSPIAPHWIPLANPLSKAMAVGVLQSFYFLSFLSFLSFFRAASLWRFSKVRLILMDTLKAPFSLSWWYFFRSFLMAVKGQRAGTQMVGNHCSIFLRIDWRENSEDPLRDEKPWFPVKFPWNQAIDSVFHVVANGFVWCVLEKTDSTPWLRI